MFFRIDIQNHRYELFDQIFLNKDGTISKNSFYKRVRYTFNCTQYSNLILTMYVDLIDIHLFIWGKWERN